MGERTWGGREKEGSPKKGGKDRSGQGAKWLPDICRVTYLGYPFWTPYQPPQEQNNLTAVCAPVCTMADGGAALPPASAASAFPDFIVSPRYRIIKRLGKGTFGAVVYVCCHFRCSAFVRVRATSGWWWWSVVAVCVPRSCK